MPGWLVTITRRKPMACKVFKPVNLGVTNKKFMYSKPEVKIEQVKEVKEVKPKTIKKTKVYLK